jgi:hypothetical protein
MKNIYKCGVSLTLIIIQESPPIFAGLLTTDPLGALSRALWRGVRQHRRRVLPLRWPKRSVVASASAAGKLSHCVCQRRRRALSLRPPARSGRAPPASSAMATARTLCRGVRQRCRQTLTSAHAVCRGVRATPGRAPPASFAVASASVAGELCCGIRAAPGRTPSPA